MTPIQRNGSPAGIRRPEPFGRPGLAFRLAAILGVLAGIATACAAADNSGAEATHSAQTIARMITDVAFQKTSAPSPTAYAQPGSAATATTGPTLTPAEIATVELSTPVPGLGRSTYSGSTPTTDGTSLLTRTLNPRCNAAFFVGDVAPILENSEVKAGATFVKTWVIRNTGTCTWYPSYFIYWHSGARMEAPAYVDFPEVVPPNQNLFLSVTLVAPEEPGKYYQRWYIRDPEYVQFGIGPNFTDPLMVRIVAV
ncbi:MAG: NBR1-Ig-like domain-containing protein [Anaerolineales bacterium]